MSSTPTGEAGLLPNAVGTDDLRQWLATHDPVSRYGKYREAVIASLRLAGYEVLDELLSHFSEEIINSARSKPGTTLAPGRSCQTRTRAHYERRGGAPCAICRLTSTTS